MPDFQKTIKALRLFNEKAVKLENSRFVKFIFEEKTGFTLSARIGEPVAIDLRGPDQDATDAFILTLRFFIQDNEPSSFRRLAETYEALPTLQHLKDDFLSARQHLNNFLDSKTMFRVNGLALSYRHVFEVFIWGGLAHANEEKKHIYDSWMQMPLLNQMLMNEFVVILAEFMNCIAYVHQLNSTALAELEKFT